MNYSNEMVASQFGSTAVGLGLEKFSSSLAKLVDAARHAAVITLQKVKHAGGEVRSRINIENQRQLKASGFSVGTRYDVSYSAGVVEVVATRQGGHVIAPKLFAKRGGPDEIGERLDLRSLQIHEKFAGQERILVIYLENRLLFLHLPTVARGLERIEQLISAVERKTLRTAALYAGIGTLDAALHEGFKQSGMHSELTVVNEIWPEAMNGLLNDNPVASARTRSFCGGIQEFIAAGAMTDTPDMVTLGIPCKGASKLNVATRDLPEMHPLAGHQVLNAVMALQRLNFPPLVLVENVTAYADSISLSMLRRVLEEQGYQTQLIGDRGQNGEYTGINSSEFGDIERRVRMALLAYPVGVTLDIEMIKSGHSAFTVGDIRLPECLVDPAEYDKGQHLNSEHKRENGWRNRIVSDADTVTPALSAGCWKQRVEDPKLVHPDQPGKCRLPLPEEHAALKGHDVRLIRSLPANSHAHTALGNGTARRCWSEFARALGKSLQASCGSMSQYVGQFRAGLALVSQSQPSDLFSEDPSLLEAL